MINKYATKYGGNSFNNNNKNQNINNKNNYENSNEEPRKNNYFVYKMKKK